MSIYAVIAVSLPIGLLLGFFYFTGLWWTVRRLSASPRPGLLALGSFIVRTAVVVLALVAISKILDWQGVLVCLLGFILARFILVSVHRARKKEDVEKIREEGNADRS